MYDPPAYVWALTIAGPTAIAAATCLALYRGAVRAGLGRSRAALLGGVAAVLLGGWYTATAVIADHGWYDTRPGQVPWLPIAAAGSLGMLLAATRIPVVARAVAAPGTAGRLVLPHAFRVTGVFFLLYLALGHLPALFALPAGLGDIAAGIAAPLVALRLAQGTGRRAAVWFNAYGLTDLAVGITLGALTGYGLLHVTPSAAPISQLPLALVIAADVPLMIALHITSLVTLARAPRPAPPADSPVIPSATTRAAAMPRPVKALNAEKKTMQLEIDALEEAAPERAVVETRGLTKRFRSVAALDGCTITVPRGRISALIGHNGAGKTTLLRILCGLARPSAGSVSVLGHTPGQGDTGFLAEVGFLAQDIPLYRRLTAEDHIAIGAHVNARWDGESVRARMRSLGIPLDRAAGKLSGGQRTQLALALTLAKRPRLLLLDEPVAALDPLARQQFLTSLTEAVAGSDLTVVMSSHLVGDLERVCDHLILITASKVRLCGQIDDILAEHKILAAPRRDTASLAQTHQVIKATHTPRQTTVLARLNGPVADPGWDAVEPGLEELILDYMGQQPARTPLTAVGGTS